MYRFYAVLVTLVSTGAVFAADLPKGTWRKTHESGATWTVTLDQHSAKWVGKSASGATTTLVAPACRAEEDGIAFGYVKQMFWVNGESKTDHSGIYPYGFAFSVKDDSLSISDFKMVGYGAQIGREISGDYVKLSAGDVAKTVPEPGNVKR